MRVFKITVSTIQFEDSDMTEWSKAAIVHKWNGRKHNFEDDRETHIEVIELTEKTEALINE